MISVYAESSVLLVEKWKKAIAVQGITCEIDVWPDFRISLQILFPGQYLEAASKKEMKS